VASRKKSNMVDNKSECDSDVTCWQNFLDDLALLGTQSKNTRETYIRGAKQFLDFAKLTPHKAVQVGKTDKIFSLLRSFVRQLHSEGKSSWTIHTYLSGVKRFFEANGVFLDENQLKRRVTAPKPKAKTEDRIPTQEQLQLVFNLMDLQGKAMLATLVSSGMRIGELIKFKLSDLHLEEKLPDGRILPPHIHLRAEYTKGKRARIVLITPEAAELLKQYIEYEKRRSHRVTEKEASEILRKYPPRIRRAMEAKIFRKSRFKSPEDRVFSMGRTTAWMKIHNAFAKAGLQDKSGNRYVFHPHCLRKYTKTMMAAAGVQESFIAMQLGHKAYLDESYFRANFEMLASQYEKAIPYLTIQKKVEEKPISKIFQLMNTLGVTPQELVQELVQMGYRFEGGLEEEILASVYEVFPEDVMKAIRSIVKKRQATNGSGNFMIVKGEEKLLEYLNQGWELVKELRDDRYLLKRG